MSEGERGEFYVGYGRRAPPGLARFAGFAAALIVAAGAALAALAAARQGPFEPGTFEYGQRRTFRGVVRERPFPVLERGYSGAGSEGALPSGSYLVAPGKLGAGSEVEGLDGRRVSLSGSLIHRGPQRMIEVEPGSAEPVGGGPVPLPSGEDLGHFRLVGEIVDSKCYLGVMKPGRTKPHRGCAVRCLSGGIPPLLVVEDRAGARRELLLVDAEGNPIGRSLLDYVAEPVEVSGRVRRVEGRLVLAADLAAIRRLE